MREDAKSFVDPRSSPQIFADEYLVSKRRTPQGHPETGAAEDHPDHQQAAT